MGHRAGMAESPVPMTPGDPHPAVTRALLRLSRPLVRVLIAKGINFQVLSRLLKAVYVDVAEREFPVDGKPQTDSRLSLLTGIHRKDIKALRKKGHDTESAPPVLSRNAHMIAIWTGAPDYLDERGRPRPLPRHRTASGGPSFEGLVDSVSKDIRARAILDEWLRIELVRLDEADMVYLNTEAFVPREDLGDLAYFFGRNLRDHIAASGHNLLGGDPPLLERAVYYEELQPKSVEELAVLARELGSDALVKVNQKAFELAQRDKNDPRATERMTFGVYFFGGPDDARDSEG